MRSLFFVFLCFCTGKTVAQIDVTFKVHAGYNYVFSNQSNTPFTPVQVFQNIPWTFYQADYIFIDLKNAKTHWQIAPQPEIGFRISLPVSENIAFQAGATLTNIQANTYTQLNQNTEKAELFFEAHELRTLINLGLGYTHEKFEFTGYLLPNFGIAKHYEAYIIATDIEGNSHTLYPEKDYFLKSDLTLGLEIGAAYNLNKRWKVSVATRLYRSQIMIRHNLNLIQFFGMYDVIWMKTVGLQLGYTF